MAFSHGLCFGKRQLTILTPSPLFLTFRLCLPSHLRTSLEMCQLALSQMKSRTFLPSFSSSSKHHERNCVVLWSLRVSRPRTSAICRRGSAWEGRGRSRRRPSARDRPLRPTAGSCGVDPPPRRRRSGWAAPPCSTSIRLGSRWPTRGRRRPPPSADRAAFFSFVQGIWGGDPPLGPHPAYPQKAREGGAYGLPRDPPFGESRLEGRIGGHIQSPQATLIPELPRRAVEHPPQGFGALPVEGVPCSLRTRGFGLQSGEATPVELADGVARRLGAAPQRAGYPRGAFAPLAGEDDLGSAHDESVLGAQRGFQLLFFGVRKRTDEDRRSHGFHYSVSHETYT